MYVMKAGLRRYLRAAIDALMKNSVQRTGFADDFSDDEDDIP